MLVVRVVDVDVRRDSSVLSSCSSGRRIAFHFYLLRRSLYSVSSWQLKHRDSYKIVSDTFSLKDSTNEIYLSPMRQNKTN